MKIAYFDCFAGISGDMILGALISSGADPEILRKLLSSLKLDGYHIVVNQVEKSHIAAIDVDVVVNQQKHHHRHLADILRIIHDSSLSDWVKELSGSIFKRLAKAEAVVHGTTPDEVHFHEVGAVDAIIDIVGAAICLELLDKPEVISSPMPSFYGFATGSHGTFPLPAPATVELLRGVPWRTFDAEGELVTPTGAAIITAIASSFGSIPPMTVEKVGYGAGKKDREFPNLLRVMIGKKTVDQPSVRNVSLIETNIDDLNPQFYDVVMERLFAAGALDVYLSPIQMKKNRPGMLISVLCSLELTDEISRIIFSETSTLGVRISQMSRICLDRKFEEVETSFGSIKVKIGLLDGVRVNVSPEYEDCRKSAEKYKVPVKVVYDAAIAAFYGRGGEI